MPYVTVTLKSNWNTNHDWYCHQTIYRIVFTQMHDVIPYFPCQSINSIFLVSFLFPSSRPASDRVLLIGQRIIWYIRPQSTPPPLSQKKLFSSRILISTNTTSASLLLIHTMSNLSAKLFNSCDRFIGGSFWLVSRFFRQQMRRKITLHLNSNLIEMSRQIFGKGSISNNLRFIFFRMFMQVAPIQKLTEL